MGRCPEICPSFAYRGHSSIFPLSELRLPLCGLPDTVLPTESPVSLSLKQEWQQLVPKGFMRVNLVREKCLGLAKRPVDIQQDSFRASSPGAGSTIKTQSWTGDGQCVKCLLHKQENVRFIPRTHTESQVSWAVVEHASNPSAGGQKQEDPQGSLASQPSSIIKCHVK